METDAGGPFAPEDRSGHRTVPHTADVRIEAWGPTREECVAEAVLATVESFLEVGDTRADGGHECRLPAHSDEDLLVSVLDELLFRLDTVGEVPVDVELTPVDGEVEIRFATVDAGVLPQVGAVPKGVSWHGLRIGRSGGQWSCAVTLDV